MSAADESATSASTPTREFLNRYRLEIAAIESRLGNIDFTIRVSGPWSECPITKHISVLGLSKMEVRTYECDGTNAKRASQIYQKVICDTGASSFMLTRATRDSGYVITEMSGTPDRERSDRVTRSNIDLFSKCAVAVMGYRVAELLEDPGCLFDRIEYADDPATKAATLRLRFSISSDEMLLRSGVLILDEESLALVGFEDVALRWSDGSVALYSGKVTYEPGTSIRERPIPTAITLTEFNRTHQAEPHTYMSVESQGAAYGNVTESSFELAAFGLSDPFEETSESPSRRSWRIAAMLGTNLALVAVALACLYWWRRGRREIRNAHP
jgi:hypothetical protein